MKKSIMKCLLKAKFSLKIKVCVMRGECFILFEKLWFDFDNIFDTILQS